MKKILFAGVLLTACGAAPTVTNLSAPAPVASAPAAVTPAAPAAPVAKATTPAPAAPVVTAQPSAPVGKSSLEFTALPAVRSPGDGLQCSAVANAYNKDLSVWVRASNCGSAGKVNIVVSLDGQLTTQSVGDQDLIIVQKVAGLNVPVTATVRVNGAIIWPHGHEFEPPLK